MKQKNNGGYSLIEVLVAISILGIIVSPVCANLLMSLRATEKTDEILQAQLAVSSAVETLMAEGIGWEDSMGDGVSYDPDMPNNISPVDCYYDANPAVFKKDRFENVTVQTWHEYPEDLYYKVEVTSELEPSVSVTTYIRAVEVEIDSSPDEGGAGT